MLFAFLCVFGGFCSSLGLGLQKQCWCHHTKGEVQVQPQPVGSSQDCLWPFPQGEWTGSDLLGFPATTSEVPKGGHFGRANENPTSGQRVKFGIVSILTAAKRRVFSPSWEVLPDCSPRVFRSFDFPLHQLWPWLYLGKLRPLFCAGPSTCLFLAVSALEDDESQDSRLQSSCA